VPREYTLFNNTLKMIIIRPYIKKIWSLKNKRLKKHIDKINRFIGKSEHPPISIILLEYA